MMVVLRLAFLILIVALLGSGGYYVLSRQIHAGRMFDAETGKRGGFESRMKNLRLTERSEKGEVWKIFAKTAEGGKEGTKLKDVETVYFSKEYGRIDMSSKTGVMQNKTRDASFFGDVRLRSSKPFLLLTERLDWKDEERVLITDEEVHIETGSAVIEGRGLLMNMDKQDLIIQHSVKAVFN